MKEIEKYKLQIFDNTIFLYRIIKIQVKIQNTVKYLYS